MSTKRVRVSIVICVYNAERLLPECLDSVLAQTCDDWELVCVDDGSTDGSLSVLRDYAAREPRLHLFPRGRNYGLFSARKFGVAQARGEYLMFLDNDDMLMPEAVEKLIDQAERAHADLVQFNVEFLFAESVSEEARAQTHSFFTTRTTGELLGHRAIMSACFRERKFSWNVWNKFYRTDLAKQGYAALEDEYLIMPEDAYAFFVISALAERMVVTTDPYYRYRVGEGVSTSRKSDAQLSTEARTVCSSIVHLQDFCRTYDDLRIGEFLEDYVRFFQWYLLDGFQRFSSAEFRREAGRHILACMGTEGVVRMLLMADTLRRQRDCFADLILTALALPRVVRPNADGVGYFVRGKTLTDEERAFCGRLVESGRPVTLLVDAGHAPFDCPDKVEIVQLNEDSASRQKRICQLSKEGRIGLFCFPWCENPLSDRDFLIARIAAGSATALSFLGESGPLQLPETAVEIASCFDLVLHVSERWRTELGPVWSKIRDLWAEGVPKSAGGALGQAVDAAVNAQTLWTGRFHAMESEECRYRRMLDREQAEIRLLAGEVCRLHSVVSQGGGLVALKAGHVGDPRGYQVDLLSGSAYFDRDWYLRTYPDVATAGLDPAVHYLETGWREGRHPSEHFDTAYYLLKHPWLKDCGVCPLVHFLEGGIATAELPNCFAEPLPFEDYRLFMRSPCFDADYYRRQLSGSVCIGDPILHFCAYGHRLGLCPSKLFNPEVYCSINPDIRNAPNPLLHYLKYGRHECRRIRPLGDEIVAASGMFDAERYRRDHGAELHGMDPLAHYLMEGWRKGYLPSDAFNDLRYHAFYLDVDDCPVAPLYHYLVWGRSEGRHPFPVGDAAVRHYPEGFDIRAFEARKDKILLVIHQMDLTGVPMLSLNIARMFRDERNVAIISPSDGPLTANCLKAGVPVIIDASFYFDGARSEWYRKAGFAFCLFNTIGVLRPFLRTRRVIPSVIWIHDNVTKDFLPPRLRSRMEASRAVFATSVVTRALVKTYAPHVRYLPYPVADVVKAERRMPNGRLRLGVVARIEPRKGQDIAVKAFKSLPAEIKAACELVIIGAEASEDFATLVRADAEGESISFLPTRKDPESYHALYEDEMDVLICPSRTDPMPLVVLDAMMHGCPLILSDQVGEMEFIREGENGFVFRSEDVGGLRDAIVKMVEARQDYARMSRAVRRTFEENFEESKARTALMEAIVETQRTFVRGKIEAGI